MLPLTKASMKSCGPALNSIVPSGAVTVLPAFSNTAPTPGTVIFAAPVTVSVAELKSPGTAKTSVKLSACV